MEKPWLTGYKMCRVDEEGRFVSCYEGNDEAIVEYKIGEKTVPADGCGPLVVSDSSWYLSGYVVMESNRKLFRCRYQKADSEHVWDLWSRIHMSRLTMVGILADVVELIEEIQIRR